MLWKKYKKVSEVSLDYQFMPVMKRKLKHPSRASQEISIQAVEAHIWRFHPRSVTSFDSFSSQFPQSWPDFDVDIDNNGYGANISFFCSVVLSRKIAHFVSCFSSLSTFRISIRSDLDLMDRPVDGFVSFVFIYGLPTAIITSFFPLVSHFTCVL